MTYRSLTGGWIGTAALLPGLCGLIVAAGAARAAEPAVSGASQPPIQRADGRSPGNRQRGASYAAPVLQAPTGRRYDYPDAPVESNGPMIGQPPAASAPQRRTAPRVSPEPPRSESNRAEFHRPEPASRQGAGPSLGPARPGPVRLAPAVHPASARVQFVRQEAIPAGPATQSEGLLPNGRSSRRMQAPFGPGADGDISLEQASVLALEYNPILGSARAQIDSASGQAVQAGLWNNPRWDTNNPYVLASGPNNQYNAGFQLEIPVAGKKRLDRRAADQQVRQARFDYRTDRMNMLTAVRQQFYGLLAQQRRVEISRELVEIARQAQSIAQAMKAIELQADVDVLPLALEFQRAEATLLQAERILEGRRRQLSATIGLPNLPINRVVGRLDSQFPVIDEARLRQFVVTQHPRILTARAEVDRRRILLRRAEVEPIPNPYTGPATAWGPTTQPTQFWYNFQFNIPIWNLNQGGRRAAAADVRDAQAQLSMLQNSLLRQAAESYARYRAAHTLAERYGQQILPLAVRNQELNREAYEKKEFEPLRYLVAQRLLTESYLEYVDALEEVWNAAADLGNLMMIEEFP